MVNGLENENLGVFGSLCEAKRKSRELSETHQLGLRTGLDIETPMLKRLQKD